MSVAAAGGAVSTQLHQPTAEQIRLAQLIDDKKHDRNEVQEIVGKILDVVTNSSVDDALLALYDCDYDCEKAVALLIEKGHEVASEWRTATNHKTSKKQQKTVTTKNGHGDVNENGQHQQRGNNGQTSRGKSRRFQQNGGDSQQQQQQQQSSSNDNYNSQQRQRGGSGVRGRSRGHNRGGNRAADRNYQQQTQNQDLSLDNLSLSDTNRRTRGPNTSSGQQQQQQQQQQQPQQSHQDQWDVGNWNGETLIYSRTVKEDGQQPSSSSTFEQASKGVNGQNDSKNQISNSKANFDPIEAARQIKNVIGIGQAPKPSTVDQQQQQQKSKVTGQAFNTKLTPPLAQARIPQQPVIFTDHFDGGVNKLDIQFGNLDDSSSASSTAMFYQQQKQNDSISSNKLSQRTTVPQQTNAHISPATRPNDQQPVMNTQRVLQQQQPSMTMKPMVTPQYTVHQQQPAPHQMNAQNLLFQSLLYHQQTQQSEPVTLDTSYDPTGFPLQSIDLTSPYFMSTAPPPPQQQTQPRYIVSQAPPPHPPQQQQQQAGGAGAKNVQTTATTTTGSASTNSTNAKKGPAVPPGMFPPTGPSPMPQQSAYSAAYGVQQQAGGAAYSTPYETEHLFANAFIPLSNAQQTQSPTGAYGSVTPPNQQQQTNVNNENKAMNYMPTSISENMMLLQQYQQFALQQSNSQQQGQQQGQQPAQLSYYLGHPPSGASYSPGHQIMYAQPATAMSQQQAPKQQNQQYNQTNASASLAGNNDFYNRNPTSANKDGQYMYTSTNQSQSSAGQQQQQQQQQQQGVNKQQRSGGNVYNNQQGHQRAYQ